MRRIQRHPPCRSRQIGECDIEKRAVERVAPCVAPCTTHRRRGVHQQDRRIRAVAAEMSDAENRPQSHPCAGEPATHRQRFQQPVDERDRMLTRPDRVARAYERPASVAPDRVFVRCHVRRDPLADELAQLVDDAFATPALDRIEPSP